MAYITYEDYAAMDGITYSTLKEGRQSAKHLQHRLKTQREDTIRLGLGRAAHCLILTPDRFPLEFAVWTGGRRAGQQWNEFCAANPDRTIIKADEYGQCLGMRDAVLAHPIAGPLVSAPGEAEEVIQWIDPLSEMACKARLDKRTAAACIDLKSTVSVEEHKFAQLAARYGYHMQAAYYSMGLRALGIDVPFKIVAVETAAPWDVAVFNVGPDTQYAGEQDVREALAMVQAGEISGRWPGRYESEELELTLPAWCFPEGEATDGLVIAGNAEEAA